MYLSQLILNPQSRWVQQDYGNRFQIHRTIHSGFAKTLSENERILFRIETDNNGSIRILVQSQEAPEWSRSQQLNRHGYLLEPIQEKSFQPRFQTEQTLRFRLVANPTMKRHGKRLPLRQDRDQLVWMERKAVDHGFRIAQLQITGEGDITGWTTGQRMTWQSTRFDGVLVIDDVRTFHTAVSRGIGSAKSFGFGLLSVMPYQTD